MPPELAIIVLTDRLPALRVLLAALAVQTVQTFDVIVLDQSDTDDDAIVLTCERAMTETPILPRLIRVPRIGDWGQTAKYEAARDHTRAEFVCFPNDDSYYVPVFVERMLHAARTGPFDLVLCDWIFDRFGYVPYGAAPATGRVDIGGFIARRSLVVEDGWSDRSHEGDGRLVERLIQRGARWGRVPATLYVKN